MTQTMNVEEGKLAASKRGVQEGTPDREASARAKLLKEIIP